MNDIDMYRDENGNVVKRCEKHKHVQEDCIDCHLLPLLV